MRHFIATLKPDSETYIVTQPQLKSLDEAKQIEQYFYLTHSKAKFYRKEGYPTIVDIKTPIP